MSPERWKQIEDLYHTVLEQEPAARGAFLAGACDSDSELKREVESLLAQASGDSPLNRPAWEGAESLLASTVAQLTPCTQLGPYKIEAPLGAGGMGEVFRAVDTRLGRPVAIKVCNAKFNARFEREARAISALNHANICTLYDVGATPSGVGFLVMELVEGQTLKARLAEGPLPVEQVRRFGIQLADALAHAHAHGIIHRDLKTANVVITPDGQAKLLDFGLAKRLSAELSEEAASLTQESLTGPGAVVGTPAYLAPEQLQGKPAEERSDIWALGVVLYEMASGVRPFQGKTVFELVSAILNQPPPLLPAGPGSAPPAWLRSVIARCLAKDPAQRYQHSDEVRAALEAVPPGGTLKAWLAGMRATSRRRWLALGIAGVLVLTILVLLDAGGVRHRFFGGTAAPVYDSVAVLPLANYSGNPEQDYLVEGMHEALITDLAKLSGLRRVIARASVMGYQKTGKSLQQIAHELGVNVIVTGAVQRQGNHVRVTAQLINPATGEQLWADRYEREMRDVLSLQAEVVTAITREIGLQLNPHEEARLASVRTVNPEAYEAYLKGMQHSYTTMREDCSTALGYFELALEKDPNYAPAYAGIAFAWLVRQQMGYAPPREAGPKAKAAALKALQLDNTLAEAHYALAGVNFYYEWDWPSAEAEFKRAIALNPNHPDTRALYSHYLMCMKRPEEAMAQMQRALELDPFNGLWKAWHAWELEIVGRYDESFDEWHKALKASSGLQFAHCNLPVLLIRKGMYEESLAEWNACYAGDPEIQEALALGHGQSGYRGAVRRAADALAARARNAYVLPTDAATLHVMAGDEAQALAWLEKGFEMRDPGMVYVNRYLEFESLHNTPRFQDIMRRMKLP